MTYNKTCNVEHKNDETGEIRICQGGEPNKASRVRLGLRVCSQCWPDVRTYFMMKHGAHGAVAADLAFRKVA